MYQSITLMWRDLEATGINPAQYFADLLFDSFYDTYGTYPHYKHYRYKDFIFKKFVECSCGRELMIALSYWAKQQHGFTPVATLGDVLINRIKNRAFSQGVSETTYIEELFAQSNADNFIWQLEL